MKNLHEFLRKNMELAINDYAMIQPGDRLLVGISGGSDSFALLKLLLSPKIYVSNDIELLAVYLDMGFHADDRSHIARLESFFKAHSIRYIIEETTIGLFAHSEKNRLNPCFLCSRMRRKRLFELASENGCSKIALGHHKDDVIETFLINILFGRETSTMVPNQEFFNGKFHIIRPLFYIEETLIKKYAIENELPVFDNLCPTGKTSKRQYVKDLLKQLEKDYRGVKKNIYRAMKNVKPDYLPSPGSVNPR
ncbi:tRNA 2-thiocytidine(32) synthetase TtcA [candidate division KSB1 bacterium]|nr:tRNA 2-thiocytidine(32) synthetase TtcA [candidate division KSB1 bacterium]